MPNEPAIGKARFTLWALVFTLGCVLLMVVNHPAAQQLALLVILASSLIETSPAEYRRKLKAPEIILAFGVTSLFLLLIVIKVFFPGIFDALDISDSFLNHPAVILPIWALCLGLRYRGASRSWKKKPVDGVSVSSR